MYTDTYVHIKFYMQVKNVFFLYLESIIDKLM